MKGLKIALSLLITASLLIGCSDDKSEEVKKESVESSIKVEETNMAIINKLTATWCGPCGDWGWDLFEGIIADNHNDAIIIGTYGSSSSKLKNPTAELFKKDFAPSAGWPAFCVNGANETEYSSTGGIYTTTTQTNCKSAVDAHKNSEVLVNAGYEANIEDGKLTIKARSLFFKDGDAAAEYKMGAYVMEDKVKETQAGKTGIVEHHHVLRGSMTATDLYGVKIEGGSTSGASFEHTFTMDIPAEYIQENLEYAVVIWKVNGSKHEFVNAYQSK